MKPEAKPPDAEPMQHILDYIERQKHRDEIEATLLQAMRDTRPHLSRRYRRPLWPYLLAGAGAGLVSIWVARTIEALLGWRLP